MEAIILKYRIKYFLQMAPDESSWATFMGQVEHSLDLPWPNLLQVKKIQIERKKHFFLKWLLFLIKLFTGDQNILLLWQASW